MQKYEIVLKNEKSKLYDKLSAFIFILNAAAIIYFLYSRYEKIRQTGNVFISMIILILTISVYLFALLKKKKKLAFLFLAIGISLYWILIGYWWIGLISIILFFLSAMSRRLLKVSFTDRIIYPSFPKRIIHWNELNNVILKDGLLTIDFKTNKFIQHIINDPDTMNEIEFNEFCKEQLAIDR